MVEGVFIRSPERRSFEVFSITRRIRTTGAARRAQNALLQFRVSEVDHCGLVEAFVSFSIALASSCLRAAMGAGSVV
jgi:hypothetical protein